MSTPSAADARRLKSSLTRLASPHDGEVVAAARAAGRILAKNDLGFADLDVVKAIPAPSAYTPRHARPGPRPVMPLREHQRQAMALAVSGYRWSEWEKDFLATIAGWARPLSAKQSDRIRACAATVAAWRAAKNGGGDVDF